MQANIITGFIDNKTKAQTPCFLLSRSSDSPQLHTGVLPPRPGPAHAYQPNRPQPQEYLGAGFQT